MATATVASPLPPTLSIAEGRRLALAMLGLAILAAVLAGWTPLAFSMATVFLFAGPHNWFEARYMLGRLPARAGKLSLFFLVAFLGIVGLTTTYAAMPWILPHQINAYTTAVAVWNSLFILWVLALVQMRARQNPRRDWFWTLPVGFFLLAGNWLDPYLFSIGMVYAHPLMALWILDRELRRSHPHWRPAYHVCLAALPLLLAALWWKLHDTPPLPEHTELARQIVDHAGAAVFPSISSHLLVATHTFLEMVHYSVWLLALPWLGLRSAPWQLDTVPFARRSPSARRAIALLLVLGLGIVLTLWVAFLADYPLTRHVYFTVAVVHVLAEVPFLLRAL